MVNVVLCLVNTDLGRAEVCQHGWSLVSETVGILQELVNLSAVEAAVEYKEVSLVTRLIGMEEYLSQDRRGGGQDKPAM